VDLKGVSPLRENPDDLLWANAFRDALRKSFAATEAATPMASQRLNLAIARAARLHQPEVTSSHAASRATVRLSDPASFAIAR